MRGRRTNALPSEPLAFRGSSFVTGIGSGTGPLYLAFAVALAAAGTAALVRNDFSTLTLCALVPSLAVAAADSGLTFYLSMRLRYSGSGFATCI